MASGLKAKTGGKKRAPQKSALYLYAVSRLADRVAPAIAAEGIDGSAKVESLRSEGQLCWISRVSKEQFADCLTDNMQDLEWLAAAGLRHQRVVAEIAQHMDCLPARFGTIFLKDESLAQHITERQGSLREAFDRVADADEWGVKIFVLTQAKPAAPVVAGSGVDYLKRKAETLQPRGALTLDIEVQMFIETLAELAVASCAGGKASAGQPGLLWHGSFLIRRNDQKRFEAELKKYAAKWQNARRIDCSGPWPPYSFVSDHVD